MASAFVTFSVVGIASAATHDEAGIAPRWFQIAERHVGDVQTLNWSIIHPNEGFPQPRVILSQTWTYQWGPEELWLDGQDGTWHAAHPRLGLSFSSNFNDVFQFDVQFSEWFGSADERRLGLGVTDRFGWDHQQLSPLIEGDGTFQSNGTYLMWNQGPGCSLDPLVRQGLFLTPAVTVIDPCLTGSDEPVTFAVGAGEVDGIATVRFTARLQTTILSVDYHEDVPEALQVEYLAHSQSTMLESNFGGSMPEGNRDVLKLVAFEAGSGPWSTGSLVLPPPVALPPIAMAPRQAWGPDESGVVHPFPASLAWQTALEDPTFTEFRDFMAAHPDAIARESEYDESRTDNQTTRTWTFHVQDSSAGYLLFSSQEVSPPGAVATDLVGLPPLDLEAMTTYSAQGQDNQVRTCDPAGHGNVPELSPDQLLPTVASVMARWQATTGSMQTANSWQIDCGLVEAGHVTQTDSRDPQELVQGGPESEGSASRLRVDWTGLPLGLVTMTTQEFQKPRLPDPDGGPVVEADSAAASPARPLQVSVAGVTWFPPSTPAASGAAALSLLAGALYWVWPTLKGGAAGLFSRIETPRLLQHPTRRSIADAVEAQPGIHYQAIVRLVPGGKGAIDHHLRKLVAAGLLVRHQGPGFTCYFPPGVDRRLTAAAGLLKSDGARRVLAAVQAKPGISSADLATMTALDASTVSHHVHRLVTAGVLQATKVGRTLVIQPTGIASQVAAAGA